MRSMTGGSNKIQKKGNGVWKIIKINGITLIALVITIIVLLILAGVTISLVLGENGIFETAKNAGKKMRYKAAKEVVELHLLEIQTDCIATNKEYTLLEIENAIKQATIEDTTIVKYYNGPTAKVKTGLVPNTVNLIGIVVISDEYPEYNFLIGRTGRIEKVLEGAVEESTEEGSFKSIGEYELETFGEEITTDAGNQPPTVVTPPQEANVEVPVIPEDVEINETGPIEITTYMAIRPNTINILVTNEISEVQYQLENKTIDVALSDGKVTANASSDSKDSCQITITGKYEGRDYTNHLTVLVEPKNMTTVTNKDENVQSAFGIYTAQDLVRLGELTNYGVGSTKNAKVMQEIDLSGICHNGTVSWKPIGNAGEEKKNYQGIFDGNGKEISNIYINEETKNKQGLFGEVENAYIKNVIVEGNITGYKYTGGIIGYANNCRVYNCINNVTVIGEADCVGGIIGYSEDLIIERCINNKIITQNTGAYVGGIIGECTYTDVDTNRMVNECINNGNIYANGKNASGISYAGGITGWMVGDSILCCFNKGNVSICGTYGGGISGYAICLIQNCYNTANISSTHTGNEKHIGGIIGVIYLAEVSKCINCGTVQDLNVATGNKVGNSTGKGNIVGYNCSGTVDESTCISITKDTFKAYTQEQIQSALSNRFKKDSNNKNEGYPILDWQ